MKQRGSVMVDGKPVEMTWDDAKPTVIYKLRTPEEWAAAVTRRKDI